MRSPVKPARTVPDSPGIHGDEARARFVDGGKPQGQPRICAHIVPLSDPAKATLAAIERRDRKHVFGRDDTGFQGSSKAQPKLDARIVEAEGKPLPHWTPHDLR